MQMISALILLIFLLGFSFLLGKVGIKQLKISIVDLKSTPLRKAFFIAGIISLLALGSFLLAGLINLNDLIELENKILEFCPFCMAV